MERNQFDEERECSKAIGERIRNLRKARKETQEKLGQVFGVSHAIVSDWERGKKLSFVRLIGIANHYGVSANFLLGLDRAQTNDIEKQAVCNYLGLSDAAVDMLTLFTKDRRNIDLFSDIYDLEKGYQIKMRDCIDHFLSEAVSYGLFACLSSLKARTEAAQKKIDEYKNESDPDERARIQSQIQSYSRKLKAALFEINEATRELTVHDESYTTTKLNIEEIELGLQVTELSKLLQRHSFYTGDSQNK